MKSSYRFISYDLIGMSQLEKIFKEGEFSINRFPEIYLDDDPTPIFQLNNEDKHKDDGIIDLLGEYVFDDYLPECINRFSEKIFTKEGKIILYSKRIEEYAKIHKLNVETVYFIVLIHELGHWFCHWAQSNVHQMESDDFSDWGKRWLLGFNLKNRRTEEALANICVHWILNQKNVVNQISKDFINEAKKAFDNLTPKKFNGLVNTENPYGAYYLIKRRKPKIIINKINELRRNWMLCDDEMMAFLRSNSYSIEEFYKNRDLTNQKFVSKIINSKIRDLYIKEKNNSIFYTSVLSTTKKDEGGEAMTALGIKISYLCDGN